MNPAVCFCLLGMYLNMISLHKYSEVIEKQIENRKEIENLLLFN